MDSYMTYELKTFSNYDTMSLKAAKFILDLIKKVVDQKHYFSLVLSGGNTPKLLYSLLGNLPRSRKIDWNSVNLFWGDERFVPHNHPESNYRMARETLLTSSEIIEKNIYPIPTDFATARDAALAYESTLRGFFKIHENSQPGFDCMLLGIGSDGHTASIFPGDPVINETKRWVLDVTAPPSYSIRQRITLTLPLINRSKFIIFLVSGKEKAQVLKVMIESSKKGAVYPAQLVKAVNQCYIFTDIRL